MGKTEPHRNLLIVLVASLGLAGGVAYFPGAVWAADMVGGYAATPSAYRSSVCPPGVCTLPAATPSRYRLPAASPSATVPAGRRGASPQSGDYYVAENPLQSGDAQVYSIPSLPEKGRWSFNPVMGTELDTGGAFVNSASESVAANGTLYGAAASIAVTFTAEDQEFDDVYNNPFVMGLGFNYGISNKEEVFGNFRYTHADSEKFDAVTVDAAVTWGATALTLGIPIEGEFDDYSAWGLEAGYRYFYNPVSFKNLPGTLHPFASAAIGFKRVNDIDLDLTFNGAEIDSVLTGIKFYDDSFAVTGGLIAGLRYDISPRIALGFETGIRYEGDLSEDDTTISGTGTFEEVNDDGDRWSIPVRAGLNIKF